jgi:hypothetical protein
MTRYSLSPHLTRLIYFFSVTVLLSYPDLLFYLVADHYSCLFQLLYLPRPMEGYLKSCSLAAVKFYFTVELIFNQVGDQYKLLDIRPPRKYQHVVLNQINVVRSIFRR